LAEASSAYGASCCGRGGQALARLRVRTVIIVAQHCIAQLRIGHANEEKSGKNRHFFQTFCGILSGIVIL
jgi:hypothetical protein